MQGLILCAGSGSRLKPLSNIIPKPLLPIRGKPVIFWTIQAMLDLKFTSIGLVIQKEDHDVFKRFLETSFNDASIDIFFQNNREGIVSAIESAMKYYYNRTVVCAGDTLYETSHLQQFLSDQSSDLRIGIQRRDKEQIIRRSNIIIDKEFRVLKTIEKPNEEEIQSSWSGSPIWQLSVNCWNFLSKVKPSRRGERLIEGLIKVLHSQKQLVEAVEIPNTKDLTYPEDVLTHNFDYINNLILKR